MVARFALALIVPLAWAHAQNVGPTLSRQQAVQIVVDFCQRIGAPVAGDSAADFPADSPTCWQPCWHISLDGVTAQVVDATGCICDYYDTRVGHGFDLLNQPEGRAIEENDAVRRATAALSAAGTWPDLVFSHASLEQMASPAKAASHVWRVHWDRIFMGVPYELPDGARVSLNAETGEVNGVAVVSHTPPPASAAIMVSAGEAADVALAQLAAAKIDEPVPFRLEAAIVRPNTQWLPGGNDTPLPGLPRVAWTCMFCAGDTYPVVFVDAATGEVIGGESGKGRGSAPAVALSKRLAGAVGFEVYRRGKNGAWPRKPLAVISDRSNEEVIRAVRKAGEPAAPPRKFGAHKIVLIGQGAARIDMAYTDGLLGLGPQWTAAPKELKELVAKLDRDAK